MTDQDEHLVHPLLQTARGHLVDEQWWQAETVLAVAVDRAKDLEAENERLKVRTRTEYRVWLDNGSTYMTADLQNYRAWAKVVGVTAVSVESRVLSDWAECSLPSDEGEASRG